MREIKFRAWGKHTQKMYEVEGLSFRHNNIIVTSDIEAETQQKLGDFELMQYTGLKDKNGKDIYDGDIVHTYDDNGNIENNGVPGLIIFKDCCFHIFDDYERLRDASAGHGNIIIIGNIHENPELLNN